MGPRNKDGLLVMQIVGHRPHHHLPDPPRDPQPRLPGGGHTYTHTHTSGSGNSQMPEMPPGVRKGWDLIFQMIFFLLNVDIWRPINKIENVNIVKLIREWFSVC